MAYQPYFWPLHQTVDECIVTRAPCLKICRRVQRGVDGAAQALHGSLQRSQHITNIGEDELYTIFWINEFFNPEDADTFFENV